MTAWRPVASGLSFPEGPVFDRDGNLFVVEVAAGRISKIAGDGAVTTHADTGGGPNGQVLGHDGALYVANNGGFDWDGEVPDISVPHEHGRIERVAPDGTVTELYRGTPDRPLDAPDDITVDLEGRLWFTDPGHGDFREPRGRVYAAAPDGTDIVEVADGYTFPNGVAFTPDHRSLIVAETGSGRLWIHPVIGATRLGERRELTRLPRGYKPDGMCLDEGGNILVAGTFGGAMFAYSSGGELLEVFELDDPYVSNVAFGGASRDEVFVTLSKRGEVQAMTWDRPGLRLPFSAVGEPA